MYGIKREFALRLSLAIYVLREKCLTPLKNNTAEIKKKHGTQTPQTIEDMKLVMYIPKFVVTLSG